MSDPQSAAGATVAMPRREFLTHVFTLALPIAFQQFMLALSSCADGLMLGGVGQNELSAVSLATQFQFIFNLILAALILGMSMLVAQYWGARDRGAVERVFGFVVRYAGLVAALFAAATLLAPELLMSLMTNDATLVALGARYLRVSSVSYLFIGISQMAICLLKNIGAAAASMMISTVGVIIHVALNLPLIYGMGGCPALGVEGAAVSTVISRGIELAWSLLLIRRIGVVRLRWRHIARPDAALRKDFWRYTIVLLGNELVWGCGFTMYTVIMGHLGADAVAANAIANIVKDLLVCMCSGMGNAGSIMVGNMLGRNDFAGARLAGRRFCLLSAIVGVLTGLAILAIRPLVLELASLTPQAHDYLSVMLLVCAYYAACKSMTGLTIGGIFPAGGDVRFGLACDSIVMWVIVVPIGLLAAFVWHLPVIWVYVLLSTDECIKMIPALLHYRRHRWLRNVTRSAPRSSDAVE
ncbi:MATE family efflux transporter [Bifidobacterium eulemuris]|uniref:MATE family efflux transporter n=2 Tax=Bifidobacterium eulemuris TaxID=1765219 RepID=A0A261G7Q5_9BIFI|nr:MATE family efflux transporter [Bifidobacterium eulemuris]